MQANGRRRLKVDLGIKPFDRANNVFVQIVVGLESDLHDERLGEDFLSASNRL